MDYAKLVSELKTDPAGIGYAGMTHKQVADAMNSAVRTAKRDVPPEKLFKLLVERGLWVKLSRLAEDTSQQTAARSEAAQLLVEVAYPPGGASIDLSSAAVAGALNTLVAAGDLQASDRNAILALSDVKISRAEEIGLPFVYEGHVESARRMF
jgi:hypothetical protein